MGKTQLIIRDWHLKKWDKVKVWEIIYEYIDMYWDYARYKLPNWKIWIWLFNFLVKDLEFYITYKRDNIWQY
jgi:hypothetical protein